jgi:hypothetical protein
MRPVRARRAVRAPKPGTLAWVAIITIALTAAWLAAQLPARADDGVRETLRITAWPAELDDVEAGVNVDAWPEARTPLDVRVQPGQAVRLDAGAGRRRDRRRLAVHRLADPGHRLRRGLDPRAGRREPGRRHLHRLTHGAARGRPDDLRAGGGRRASSPG